MNYQIIVGKWLWPLFVGGKTQLEVSCWNSKTQLWLRQLLAPPILGIIYRDSEGWMNPRKTPKIQLVSIGTWLDTPKSFTNFFCCKVAIIFFLMLKTFLRTSHLLQPSCGSIHCRAIFWGVFEPSNWASLAATVATYLFRTTLAKWEANRKQHKVLIGFEPYQNFRWHRSNRSIKSIYRRILYTEFYYMLCLWDIMHWFHVSRVHTRFPSKSNACFPQFPETSGMCHHISLVIDIGKSSRWHVMSMTTSISGILKRNHRICT